MGFSSSFTKRFNPKFSGMFGGTEGVEGSSLELNGLVLIAGQSNAKGNGNTSQADSGLAMDAAFAGAMIDTKVAATAGNPLVWTEVARRSLQPYAAPGTANMGVELSLGRYLAAYSSMTEPIEMAKMAVNGIDIGSYLSTSTYPNTDPNGNLWTQFVTYIDARLAATSRPLGVLVWIQGESDATLDDRANAYAGNLDTFFGELRAEYGEGWLLVLVGLNEDQIDGVDITQARFDTVNAAKAAYAAANSANTIYVDVNRIPVADGSDLHYLVDQYWSLGNLIGEATAEKLQPGRGTSLGAGPAPWIQVINEPTLWSSSGTATLTIRGPAVHQAGDRDFLVLGTGQLEFAPVLGSAAGFTLVPGAQSQSQFSTSVDCYCHVYTRVADQAAIDAGGGRLADPTLTDNNNNIIGFIFTVRGSDQTAAGINAVATSANNASNTTANITGVTTTENNCLVLYLQTTFSGSSNAASWSNATLPDFVVDRDSINPMNVTVTVGHGTLATAGSTGNVTGTRAAASTTASVCIAVAP